MSLKQTIKSRAEIVKDADSLIDKVNRRAANDPNVEALQRQKDRGEEPNRLQSNRILTSARERALKTVLDLAEHSGILFTVDRKKWSVAHELAQRAPEDIRGNLPASVMDLMDIEGASVKEVLNRTNALETLERI